MSFSQDMTSGLASSLSALAAHLVGGVLLWIACGFVAAGAMRHFHLHWSWAVVVLAAVVLVPAAFAGLALPVAVTAFCAALSGQRLHREDVRAGADLGRLAAERYGPHHALRLLWQRYAGVLQAQPRPPAAGAGVSSSPSAGRTPENRLRVGTGRHKQPVTIPFGLSGSGQHTLVVGATGKGKTVTETWIAASAVAQGLGAVVVDPKGDSHMRDQLAAAAQREGRRFLQWTPAGPHVYNPLGAGASSEVADKALAAERFSEPHYQRQAQRYLAHAVRTLQAAGETVSPAALVRHLDPDRLAGLAQALPGEQAQATCEYVEALTARQRSDLAGVRDRLAILVESDVGPWLEPTDGGEAFELRSALCERGVVYFDLHADSRPLLAQMLGAAVVQDLIATAAAVNERGIPSVVVLDEFAALGAEHVGRLFARARSAGMNLVLGAQELSDLRLSGRETLLEQVQGNIAAAIAHGQASPASIDMLVRMAGTCGAWQASQDEHGGWRRTRTSAPLLEAEQIRGLPPSFAAVIEMGSARPPQIARMCACKLAAPQQDRPA